MIREAALNVIYKALRRLADAINRLAAWVDRL
jgi:hypothetical protein